MLYRSALTQMSDNTKSEYENKIFSENTFLAQIKKKCMSGESDFLSQYYIYLYILYIYIYIHPKFCISHQERKSFSLRLFNCKLYILGESKMVVAGELRKVTAR